MRKLAFFLSFLVLFFGLKTSVFAEKINSFDTEIVAHKDGTMTVTENIKYDFEYGDRHGIYRYIPLYSRVGEFYRVIDIKDVAIERDGKKENFETTKNKEQIYFKIGNANKTITGEHDYKISYTVENGVGSNFPEFDEIYWNITGNDWLVPIDKASSNIRTDFGIKHNRVICFTRSGNYNAQFCREDPSGSGNVITTSPINPGDGLTVAYAYPKGTFPASFLSKELPQTTGEKILEFFARHFGFIYLFLNVALPIGILIWYQRHKNKKRFGKPVVNFELPKDSHGKRIAPALVGTIDNAKLDRDDVVATLYDLAIRKYIKFEEIKTTRNLLPDSKKQKIIKLKENDGQLNEFENILFLRLFKDGGDYVFIDEIKKDFYKTYQVLESEAFKLLVAKKYFVRNPKGQRALLFVLAFGSLATGNILLAITLFFLTAKLIGRTELGDEVDYKIDGLKLFLKSMDRNYKWQSEKFYTVEQMIPYAMSLGFINQFMEQLKIIKPDYNPTWYTGYHGSFYMHYGAFYSSVNSNMTTSAPSSSSGSSGGFSGGGGGGGGGGSW